MRSLVLLLLLCPLPAGAALAQGDIHRCIGADGDPVFTDRVCADVHATPLAPAPTASAPAAAGGESPAAPHAPPALLCATDLHALRQGVIDAFAARDPNRLAGLMLWEGYGDGAVVADIRGLGELMRHPLLDIDATSAADSVSTSSAPLAGSAPASTSSASAPATQPPDELRLHTASDDGSGRPHETRFALEHRSGCLWLRQLD